MLWSSYDGGSVDDLSSWRGRLWGIWGFNVNDFGFHDAKNVCKALKNFCRPSEHSSTPPWTFTHARWPTRPRWPSSRSRWTTSTLDFCWTKLPRSFQSSVTSFLYYNNNRISLEPFSRSGDMMRCCLLPTTRWYLFVVEWKANNYK
jgi:hypothetical protein